MTDSQPDPYKDIMGVDFSPERLAENLQAFTDILRAIQKLRTLDLSDLHPAVVFDPSVGYPEDTDS